MSDCEVKSGKCSEEEISSDDTEFMDLPLPPVPTKATEIHNVDVHPSVAAYLMSRMDYFDLRHVDSGDEVHSISEDDDTPPPPSGKSFEGTTPRQESSIWFTSDEETAPYVDKSPLLGCSEASSLEILENFRGTRQSSCDDSTCCDEDFTWVRSENISEEPQSLPVTSTTIPPSNVPSGKPPRPAGSLDRRRQLTTNRQERDSKSRSAHSLIKDKSLGNEQKEKHAEKHLPRTSSFEGATEGAYPAHRRESPGFWEPPPPSYPYHWETPPHPFWPSCHASREELRFMEMHRRHQDQLYRYGSSGALNSSHPDMYGCCQQRYHPPPPPPCCSCERLSHWNLNQRQDIDERLRRLQSDKESLALQVQVLSEQVAAQNEKISDLERMLTEKTQLLSNADDLLHREMLSRSSLETQKLELMSAMSELKLQQAALERENLELRTSQINNNSIMTRRPPMAPSRAMTGFSATPPPHGASGGGSLTSTPLGGSHGNLQQHSTSTPATPKTPPASFRRQVDVVHYNSLPRQSFPTTIAAGQENHQGGSGTTDTNANPKRNVAFGKDYKIANPTTASTPAIGNIYHHQLVLFQPSSQLKGFQSKRGFSVPNLAETEKVIEDNHELSRSFTPQPSPSPSAKAKSSFRSIFGKIRRSNSGTLEDLPAHDGGGDFKRGGFRSTAGARLGWSGVPQGRPERPIEEWDVDSVCTWLETLGLGAHEEDARRWLKHGGVELIKASPVDVEKELGLKNPLHRKKIVLALAEMAGKENDELFQNAGKLDCAWILRWLDDVGLPQHKDTFSAARLDGRMLHKLTMEDLATLHVTSSLHAASLRRGIQVLRDNNFSPDCLIRRSGGDEGAKEGNQVMLWTAHRVMEWLRVVDLAEYAPNLRGAGVHGALMMLEPRFNAELLADLLSIPPSKTLLRRHLATHFKELLGRDVIQSKRDAENVLGFTPLTLTAKIKTPKKSQFSLKRKKSTKGGDEWSDYVCPMGSSDEESNTSGSRSRVRGCLSAAN
ncbi:liprin-beta-2 isoform X2 [Lutzomyia longipalpis]|uniref:liprin-beta-2 isoform X2 n=1 Tax=Lutzomyia longipalpis TaxID=7200 RepID=UPI002484608D|nr:liprin-beta-2 isoform X2 [Lutzomyia longipalpis]